MRAIVERAREAWRQVRAAGFGGWVRLEMAVLVLAAILVVQMSVSTAMFVLRSRSDTVEEWRRYMDHFATMTAAHANQTIQGCDLLLQRVLDRVAAYGIDDEASFRRIMGSRETYDLIKEEAAGLVQTDVVTIADTKGDVINLSRSYPPPPGMNLAEREHFRVQMDDPNVTVFVSRPVIAKTTGRWVFFLSRKIRGKSGRVLGMVSTGIESAFLSDFYRSVSIAEGGHVGLLRADGTLLARYPVDERLFGKPYSSAVREMVASGLQHKSDVVEGPRQSNASQSRMRIVAVSAVPRFPLAASATITEDQMLERWRAASWFMGMRTLGADVIVLGCAFWFHYLLRRQRLGMETLRKATIAAREGDRAKSEFLANMSHEIRTPLNGILGYAELLHRDLAGTDRAEFAKAIRESGEHLLGIVDDVLDLRRIEAGALELRLQPEPVADIVEAVVRSHRPCAEAKGLRLEARIGEAVPPYIVCDRVRLAQVLKNLVHNAVKFTRQGSVELFAMAHPEGIEFRVADTGPGIEPAHQQRIFDKFTQVDASRVRAHEGAGLGLTLVRELAHLMGGRVKVDSRVGAGSTFSLLMPLKEVVR